MALSKGSKGEAVKSLQSMLNYLHYQGRKSTSASSNFLLLSTDGIFGSDTEDAVILFQGDQGLYEDGIAGPVTLKMIERLYVTKQSEFFSPIPAKFDKFEITTGPSDSFEEGYTKVRLRNDVMMSYMSVFEEVHRRGGILTSSGGIRDLCASVHSNRSATSFHYSGRALDLYIWSGMKDPKTDPYVVQRLGERKYRVYARCSKDKSASSDLPKIQKLDDLVTYQNRTKGTSVTDHFLDLTGLFELHGFKPIRARQGFESGKSGPLGAEWWHFQWETGLIAGTTTFGDELRKIYPDHKIKACPPWNYRDYIWQQDWF